MPSALSGCTASTAAILPLSPYPDAQSPGAGSGSFARFSTRCNRWLIYDQNDTGNGNFDVTQVTREPRRASKPARTSHPEARLPKMRDDAASLRREDRVRGATPTSEKVAEIPMVAYALSGRAARPIVACSSYRGPERRVVDRDAAEFRLAAARGIIAALPVGIACWVGIIAAIAWMLG